MFDRNRLDRERLEVYLVYLLLAWRPMLMMGGTLLIVVSAALWGKAPLLGCSVFVAAALLLLLSFSYRAALWTARLGAWAVHAWKTKT